MDIAALLTCYNRKEKTVNCLESLFKILPNCDVFLVDDASTDGTSETIEKLFPHVNIIQGTGDLYWSRGMYVAWSKALKHKYDFYLWLNDDISLYSYFFNELLKSYEYGQRNCIVAGTVEDSTHTSILYGGRGINNKKVIPDGSIQEIILMNGNVVLIPQKIVEDVGIIDPHYHHDLGDLDYCLRVRTKGYKAYTTSCPIAMGYPNKINRLRKSNTKLKQRFIFLYSPLGANPNIYFYFYKKHYGFGKALMFYLYIHIINFLPDNLVHYVYKIKK